MHVTVSDTGLRRDLDLSQGGYREKEATGKLEEAYGGRGSASSDDAVRGREEVSAPAQLDPDAHRKVK